MMQDNTIPEMTDPLGKAWSQPERSEILIDDTHALMSRATLLKLANYSHSNPTGCYPGKMWKRERLVEGDSPGRYKGTEEFYLCWFGNEFKKLEREFCKTEVRQIIIL